MRVSAYVRLLAGGFLGAVTMLAVVNIFTVNTYDFEHIQAGVRAMLAGYVPWGAASPVLEYYNPPHAVLFLWPTLFLNAQIGLVLGACLTISLIFYLEAWAALAWFTTATALWVVSAGNIDMLVVSGGLLLLFAGDNTIWRDKPAGIALRVLAFGLLAVKPQGTGILILLYVLCRRDIKSLLIAGFVYIVLFLPYYPDWIGMSLHSPPASQTVAAHSFLRVIGVWPAVMLAGLAAISRRWKWWTLGGALAGILAPYGMPGLPILLTLTSVTRVRSIVVYVLFSAGLTVLTWKNPPTGVDYYTWLNPLMAVYHLGMLGMSIALAVLDKSADPSEDTVDVSLIDLIKERE